MRHAWRAHRLRRLIAHVPQDPADDQAGTYKDEQIERLSVEPPPDDRDQRYPQKVERHHKARVASLESLAHAVVRQHAGDAEPGDSGRLSKLDPRHEPRPGRD